MNEWEPNKFYFGVLTWGVRIWMIMFVAKLFGLPISWGVVFVPFIATFTMTPVVMILEYFEYKKWIKAKEALKEDRRKHREDVNNLRNS